MIPILEFIKRIPSIIKIQFKPNDVHKHEGSGANDLDHNHPFGEYEYLGAGNKHHNTNRNNLPPCVYKFIKFFHL